MPPTPVPIRKTFRHARVFLTGEGGDESLGVDWGFFWDMFWGRKFKDFFYEMSWMTRGSQWLFYKRLIWSTVPRPVGRAYALLRGRTNAETCINPDFAQLGGGRQANA